MIYKTLGTNRTGQMLVGCPHISPLFSCDMHELDSGAILYELCGMMGPIMMLPTSKTIALWCVHCYETLDTMAAVTKSESRWRSL